MCGGLSPTYWTTFGSAEKNRNGSWLAVLCTNETIPPFFEFLTPPPSACQGPMDPRGARGTSAHNVLTCMKYGVDPSTRCWDIAQKTIKMQKFHVDSYSKENFISLFFGTTRAANPQKGRRHIRNQSMPACKIWRESARGLSRNVENKKRLHSTFWGNAVLICKLDIPFFGAHLMQPSELHKVEPTTLLRFARATKRFS